MFLNSRRSRSTSSFLFTVVLGLQLLTACDTLKTRPDSAKSGTGMEALVQTADPCATPASISPIPTISSRAGNESYDRVIKFSGREWKAKSSNAPVGPGPNYFSNSSESVWVDPGGQLHLKLVRNEDKWACAEVVTAEPLGYGSYQFRIARGAASLDRDAVLGLFTWDTTAPQFDYREIDIELSRWGEEGNLNAQFVVQPWDHPGNRHRFAIDSQADSSTQVFVWSAESVQFRSFVGDAQSPDPNALVEQWSYTGMDTPPEGGSVNARINLWLIGGQPPSDGTESEIVLSSFDFTPQAPAK